MFWLLLLGALYFYLFRRAVRWAWPRENRSDLNSRKQILIRALVLSFFLSPALLVGGEGFAILPFAALVLAFFFGGTYLAFGGHPNGGSVNELLLIFGWNALFFLAITWLLYSLLGIRKLAWPEVAAPWFLLALSAAFLFYGAAFRNWMSNGVLCEERDVACYSQKVAYQLDPSLCSRVSGSSGSAVSKGCLLTYAAFSRDFSVCDPEGIRSGNRPEMYQCALFAARRSKEKDICVTALHESLNQQDCLKRFQIEGPLRGHELF